MDGDEIADLFASFGAVRTRRMFGGTGIYADGLMFALEIGGDLYLKTDTAFADDLAGRGSRPFTYQAQGRGVTTMSYWLLPEAALDDSDDLAQLARRALAVARASAARPKRQRAERSSTKRQQAGSPNSKRRVKTDAGEH